MSKVKKIIDENQPIFDYVDQDKKKSYWTMLKSLISCRSSQEPNRKGCYIMTIGVIDECRKLGIGTLLLQQHEQSLKQSKWA